MIIEMTNCLSQSSNMNFRICNGRSENWMSFYHDCSINLKTLLDTIDKT